MMLKNVKRLYWNLITDRSEEETIAGFLRKAGLGPVSAVLDVGCGYGRNLMALRNMGFNPTGVEINPVVAEAVRKEGFHCIGPGEFEARPTHEWDAILMSHIIEHFEPRALLEVIDGYLSRLRSSGLLIIASPLPNRTFYDNFDHVKPYTPQAIEEVFGMRNRQVQFQSYHELELIDLWIRRRAFRFRMSAAMLRRTMSVQKTILGTLNVVTAVSHRFTGCRIGVADGWVGIYRKIS
jgi:SAM-dependent methyltransferase